MGMRNLTVERAAAACGAEILGAPPAGELAAVTTDSRAVTPGCLFAAIRGARADGHDFIAGALAGGAACALAERVPPDWQPGAGCLLRVPDTTAALQRIAACYRDQFPGLPLLGVTGSAGKTTAKEMAAAVLGRRFAVHKTAGNFNNDLGVPLTLFGLTPAHQAAVVELGVSHPGDMARIAAVARPTMALYTNIGDAHLEFLKSRAGVFAEKSVLNDYLTGDRVVLCNGDDPLLAGMETPGRKLTFGLGPGNDLRALDAAARPDGSTAFTLACGDRRIPVTVPAFGEHIVYAALAGAAAGLVLGLTDAEIAAGAAAYAPAGSRARLLRTGALTVIDDCYNANPTSMASALRSLAGQPGRRVCVLGDMLELGPRAAALHAEMGALARSLGVDLVLTLGPLSAHIAAAAGDAARHFADRAALLEALPALLRPGDTVLVKASRGMRFEEITEALRRWQP